MDVLHDESDRVVTTERWHSGTEFIEDDAKGVNVTALIARKTERLLWWNIERGSQPRTGQCGCGSTKQLDQAKVGEDRYRLGGGIALVQQNIGRFEVAVSLDRKSTRLNSSHT